MFLIVDGHLHCVWASFYIPFYKYLHTILSLCHLFALSWSTTVVCDITNRLSIFEPISSL